ncbi:MAG TPA: dienelactone hydrolase family protein [Acetobacteraceae bacterium]|jgi:carboxymethylenebutenolidase|nr:dienelactone hydrolase family protein [Acetobacteraceae bacterium]
MNDMSEVAGLRRYPLARRGFVMTSLMTGFTLATTVVEAQAIHTDTSGLDAGEVQIPVKDGHLPAYYARPAEGTNFPTILVNEEIFGVNAYIQDVCRRFAKLGYLAVAPEIYARIADISKMTDIPQVFREVISKKPDAELFSDLDATLAWAAQNKGSATAIGETGFCRGGRNTWLYATHNPNLKAAVAWYGPIKGPTSEIQPKVVLDLADQLKCPLLGLYGAQDTSISVADVHEAEAKAKSAGKTVEIVIYPDAPHGFHADYRPSYRQADAEDGWKRALAWFKRYGV